MNRHRDKLRELARSRVSVRVTTKTRSSTGYVVLAPRLRIEVRPR